jgi:hypothetical protein
VELAALDWVIGRHYFNNFFSTLKIGIISGSVVITAGFAWSGTILGSAGLVGIVSVFIYGTRSNRKERENKR